MPLREEERKEEEERRKRRKKRRRRRRKRRPVRLCPCQRNPQVYMGRQLLDPPTHPLYRTKRDPPTHPPTFSLQRVPLRLN